MDTDDGVSEMTYCFLCELLCEYGQSFVEKIQKFVQSEENERGILYFFLDEADAIVLRNDENI